MPATAKNRKAASSEPSDNALAKKVIEEVQKIDAEAKQKKLAQVDSLQQARDNILQRIEELQHQLGQIDKAMEAINGKPAAIKRERRVRRNLDEVRERVGRWMEGHKGEKFAAGDLAKEFPELAGTPMSYFLKPLVESGQVKADASQGIRRTKYFVKEE